MHSFAVDVIMQENKIQVSVLFLVMVIICCTAHTVVCTVQGVVMESKSGRRAILADRVIDCTGDADVAHLAGAEYRKTVKSESMGCAALSI